MIEVYYGGALAAELEAGGKSAFFDFAARELNGLLGADFAKRIALANCISGAPIRSRGILFLCASRQGGQSRRARRAG